jgi:hypothetical protein
MIYDFDMPLNFGIQWIKRKVYMYITCIIYILEKHFSVSTCAKPGRSTSLLYTNTRTHAHSLTHTHTQTSTLVRLGNFMPPFT